MTECIIGACRRPGIDAGPDGFIGRCQEHRVELQVALAAAQAAPPKPPEPPKRSNKLTSFIKNLKGRKDKMQDQLLVRLLKRTTLGREHRSGRDVVVDADVEVDLLQLEREGVLTPRGTTAEKMARLLIIDRPTPRAQFVDEGDRKRVLEATTTKHRRGLYG